MMKSEKNIAVGIVTPVSHKQLGAGSIPTT